MKLTFEIGDIVIDINKMKYLITGIGNSCYSISNAENNVPIGFWLFKDANKFGKLCIESKARRIFNCELKDLIS